MELTPLFTPLSPFVVSTTTTVCAGPTCDVSVLRNRLLAEGSS
jgi:hypothetical protein